MRTYVNGSVALGGALQDNHTATAAELYFRVAAWLSRQRNPSVEAIREEFSVHRSTAYRWLSAWRAAQGSA